MSQPAEGPSNNILEALENNYLNSLLGYISWIPRVIWALLGTVMLAFALYLATLLLIDYTNFPSHTEISSSSSNEYHLPAITICNINILNKTKMETNQVTADYSVYDLYMELSSSFNNRGEDVESNVPYEKLDDLDLYRNYHWDIKKTLDYSSVMFAKSKLSGEEIKELINVEYTEMGNCLEINDNQMLVQRVNGATGGFSITLDTRVAHYTDDTISTGFFIMFRMPGETVVNKEYAFKVSPGKEIYVELDTVQVSRLGKPWGTCENTDDIFTLYNKTSVDAMDVMTVKECFASSVTWMYMYSDICRCYPWYIYARFISEEGAGDKTNTALEDNLKDYWQNDLPVDKQITFDTIEIHADQYSYEGTSLNTTTSTTPKKCAVQCQEQENCVYFMWTRFGLVADLTSGGECKMFDSSAELTDELAYKVTRGTVEGIGELEECSITKEEMCNNMLMDALMDTTQESAQPVECSEPCSYNNTIHSLSYSEFPSEGHWVDSLSDKYPHYTNIAAARRNLVKLVFFQSILTTTTETQTASYEIQNLIAELGGTFDLFVGISFYSLFKLIEWLLRLMLRGLHKKSDEKHVNNVAEI